eukprot:TRINITY_DN37978_c0_g1_i1.p1 TRINITY_DN37978_c0_g1~~TRINITY_DN37978_c0_g1_i1.p1  ORF type:complete len:529 (+),score=105.69 TRINITY_DN37978_c0_g1_i1:183-1769(+)
MFEPKQFGRGEFEKNVGKQLTNASVVSVMNRAEDLPEPPSVGQPPLPRLVRAAISTPEEAEVCGDGVEAEDGGDAGGSRGCRSGGGASMKSPEFAVLTRGECERIDGEPLEICLALGMKCDLAELAESLSCALVFFPSCVGRLAVREVRVADIGQGPVVGRRLGILCNNAGIPLSTRELAVPMPSLVGPMPSWCFDRAAGGRPGPAGAPGTKPLLKVRVLNFVDGRQMISLSFVRALADVGGVAVLLKTWAAIHRGEETPPSLCRTTRTGLESSVGSIQPRLHADFALLHRGDDAKAVPPVAEPTVVSLLLPTDRIEALVDEMTQTCRKRRLIFNSDTLTWEEVAIASVVDTLRASLPMSMIVDYREVFAVEFGAGGHFGTASYPVEFDLPASSPEAAATLRKRLRVTTSRDFWAWKLGQARRPESSRLYVESWLRSLDLRALSFGRGCDVGPCDGSGTDSGIASALGVGLSGSFWRDWAMQRAPNGAGCVVLLPHVQGLQVAALLPRTSATKFEERHGCESWHPCVG